MSNTTEDSRIQENKSLILECPCCDKPLRTEISYKGLPIKVKPFHLNDKCTYCLGYMKPTEVDIHHEIYDDDEPYANTVQVCRKCHNRYHYDLKQLIDEYGNFGKLLFPYMEKYARDPMNKMYNIPRDLWRKLFDFADRNHCIMLISFAGEEYEWIEFEPVSSATAEYRTQKSISLKSDTEKREEDIRTFRLYIKDKNDTGRI